MNRAGLLRWAVAGAAILLAVAGSVRADAGGEPEAGDNPAPLDWTEWQSLPVFHDGRLKPLDTVARSLVEDICGSAEPTLSLRGVPDSGDLSEADRAAMRELFPGGRPRTFAAAELAFSWLVEPEKWEHVPVFYAKQETLRKEFLGVPVTDSLARRLRYVALGQILDARWFQERLAELAEKDRDARRRGEEFKPLGIDKKIRDLYHASLRFREITFDNQAFQAGVSEIAQAAFDISQDRQFQSLADGEAQSQPKALIRAVMQAAQWGTRHPWMGADLSEADKLVGEIETQVQTLADTLAQPKYAAGAWHAQTQRMLVRVRDLRAMLYDNGCDLRLVAALNPLVAGADADGYLVHPWLNVHTMLSGSWDSVARYVPQGGLAGQAERLKDEFQEVSKAFDKVKAVYLDRGAPDRPERFALAMEQFAEQVRALGEKIEPLRRNIFENKHPVTAAPDKADVQASEQELLDAESDRELLEKTEYPAPGFGELEVLYNRAAPFYWAWVVGLVAAACFVVSLLVPLRGPLLATGIVILLLSQAVTLGGFVLRGVISGWVPLASMFETIVFAALIVSVVGLGYAVLPILVPGLKRAWPLTGIPYSWETRRVGRRAVAADAAVTSPVNLVLGGLRGLLSAGLFVYLFFPLVFARVLPSVFGSGGIAALHVLPQPDKGADFPTVNNVLVWVVVMAMVLPAVWYGPRMILSAVVAVVTVPQALRGRTATRAARRTVSRTPFVLVATLVAAATTCLAYYAPMFDSDIKAISAVLRSNFWLFIHVTPIVAGFGAGVLAWGLGNLALAYYLFGRYRGPAGLPPQAMERIHRPAPRPETRPRWRYLRAPKGCRALSRQTYKAIQLAVLLITAGTILGAVWADVSWGRSWGWDRKEVWSLISILIYLFVLHARHAGWVGHFGLAVGSVLGFTAVLMTWYGVNYLIPGGRHAYGSGAGGQAYVGIFVGLNWAFLFAATVRYLVLTHTPADDAPVGPTGLGATGQ